MWCLKGNGWLRKRNLLLFGDRDLSVTQTGLKLPLFLPEASYVLGLQVCATTSLWEKVICFVFIETRVTYSPDWPQAH